MAAARLNEREISNQIKDVLDRHVSADYAVHVGKSILYQIQVGASGKVIPEGVDSPVRGQYAFQTDILIEKRTSSIPLVVIELKCGSFSTHDVITYSAKAERHKGIYRYLRYGLVVVGIETLGRRFVIHNQNIDFAMALIHLAPKEQDLVAVIKRQIASAERLADLLHRARIARYEETVEIS